MIWKTAGLAAFAVTSLGILPSFARAGEKVGNGGVAVVCRTAAGAITSAELLDIFEGVNQMSLSSPDRNIGVDLEIDIAKTRMVSNPSFLSKFTDELAAVKSNLVFLPRGIGLEPTNDAFPVINKRGCKFENVANYSTDGRIYIDSEIFQELKPVHQAALYVHETVYAIARNVQGETSSVRSRKLTAQIMASQPDLQVVKSLMEILGTAPTPVPVDQTGGIVEGRFDPIGTAKYCSWQITRISTDSFYLVAVARPNLWCRNGGKMFKAQGCNNGNCIVINVDEGNKWYGDEIEVLSPYKFKYQADSGSSIYQK